MIELHSHLLYGMDDGAGDLDESLRMLTDYAAQGVTEIACTPHLLPESLAADLDDAAVIMHPGPMNRGVERRTVGTWSPLNHAGARKRAGWVILRGR